MQKHNGIERVEVDSVGEIKYEVCRSREMINAAYNVWAIKNGYPPGQIYLTRAQREKREKLRMARIECGMHGSDE